MAGILLDACYLLGLVLTSPVWLWRMIRHGRYRDGLGERLGAARRRHGTQPAIWIHAVSLGEINGIRQLVRDLGAQLPEYQVVISTTTDTGMARARHLYEPRYRVFRFPLDFTWVVRRAFDRIRPDLVVLMEGEAWPNFLALAHRRGVPVVMVNGRMSANKGYPRYKRIRPIAQRLFNRLTRIGVQDAGYAERFADLGVDTERVVVTGMMKYDSAVVADTVDGAAELAAELGLTDRHRLVVAGGTGPGEEAMLLAEHARLRREGRIGDDVVLALVPRKPERFDETARLIERERWTLIRRSQHDAGNPAMPTGGAVILLDTMGELRKLYSLATAIFVGRSLVPMGGSDMIEAAALGKPVAFGPHVFNFPQAEDLVDAGVVRRVSDARQWGEVLAEWLADPAGAGEMGRRAQAFVRSRQGATLRNVEMICEVLGRVPSRRPGGIATRGLRDASADTTATAGK